MSLIDQLETKYKVNKKHRHAVSSFHGNALFLSTKEKSLRSICQNYVNKLNFGIYEDSFIASSSQ